MKKFHLSLFSMLLVAPATAQQFVATVEADNGTPYMIIRTNPVSRSGAEAIVNSPNGPLDMVYDCIGNMMVTDLSSGRSSNLQYVPPRSVAAKIGQIACAKSAKKVSSE